MTEQIDRELVVPAAPEEVWAVVTADGWLAEEVSIELVPGGEARFTDRDRVRTGWVEEARPPFAGDGARLTFWWSDGDEPASRVELALEPEPDGATRLRIREARPLDVLDVVGIPLPGPGGAGYGRGGASYGPAMVAAAAG